MKSTQHPHRHETALERFNERFESEDDSWYAERLELLGTVMFGDLWKTTEEFDDAEHKGTEAQSQKTV